MIEEEADEDALIIWGASIDPTLQDEIKFTVVATGFQGIENLLGGSSTASGPAIDIFRIEPGGSISGAVDGGAGTDILIGPDVATTWDITGANAGTVATTVLRAAVIIGPGSLSTDMVRHMVKRLPSMVAPK